MRIPIGLCIVLALVAMAQPQAKSNEKPKEDKPKNEKAKKEAKTAVALMPKNGIRTPGVLIPFSLLKAEAEFTVAPAWMIFTDSPLLPNPDKGGFDKIDPKTNKLVEPITGLNKPCGGAVTAFTNLWIPTCGDNSIVRFDSKTGKVTKSLPVGAYAAVPSVAATTDSVWAFTDDKITLSRIDPDQNAVVAELRLPPNCNSLTFGEAALWVTCPADNRILRINTANNTIEKHIETSAGPKQLLLGEGSVWVLCEKDGKIDRIDPKTNKVSKSIDLGAPAVGGMMADGLGSLWVTMPGFPLTRIDTTAEKEKIVQQFYGDGGGAIHIGLTSLWLTNSKNGTLWRIDPKRVAATLAE